MENICVYCGSSAGSSPEYKEGAGLLAKELLKRNIGLVYGGAKIGIMGEIADRVLSGGGKVTGIMPKSLAQREIAHPDLTELKVVASMHERKTMMAELSDGFIALPGGLGTLEEIFEVLTWAQLGFHQKPCALLNVGGYYDLLAAFLDTTTDQGFVSQASRDNLIIENDPARVLDRFKSHVTCPGVNKWNDKKSA